MSSGVIDGEELQHISAAEYSRTVRARIGDGPTFMSFEIDVLDPSIAPGTGTTEIGGLRAHQALSLIRALAGISFTGFDVVEVSPHYDTPAQVTALHAATVAYEMLALLALTHQ